MSLFDAPEIWGVRPSSHARLAAALLLRYCNFPFIGTMAQVLKTASKQWCNIAPLRKVSASETFSYGTAGFAQHSCV